jgi:hypothetical protein
MVAPPAGTVIRRWIRLHRSVGALIYSASLHAVYLFSVLTRHHA